jgi:hypothetical protein
MGTEYVVQVGAGASCIRGREVERCREANEYEEEWALLGYISYF